MGEIECTKCIYNINGECKIGGWTIPKVGCPDGKAKPITNADRIRNMGDIELANFLSGLTNGCVNCPMYDEWQIGTADECGKHCNSSWQNWVKRESEGD